MLKKEYDELKSSTDIDKRFALHQAFRDLLLAKTGDIPAIEKLISFAVAACRSELGNDRSDDPGGAVG
ncbi:nuclear matrix protein [Culex quinquefasciatus]|uniref:Nuclear matrix protein n=1 Tax=Culex quinquefasciatus TaxID=7176 RepID=B0XIT0_CULQU|nr:nuclear matrix protein [Culex quinquefasciatus]|eukprot:XP_001869552.1 nuclear matrix protein [Culex quinquefasciatus]